MKIINSFSKKIFKLYNSSYLSVHISMLLTIVLINWLLSKLDIQVDSNSYLDILNGMGILTAFFILVMDKLELRKLNERYQRKVICGLFKRKEITEGVKLSNTVFSLTISMFTILGISYTLLLFNHRFVFLLVSLIVYVFISFIITLAIWHAFELKDIN